MKPNPVLKYLYAFTVVLVLLLAVLHLFNVYTLKVDAFSFFILSVLIALLLLPLVKSLHFMEVVKLTPGPKIFRKK